MEMKRSLFLIVVVIAISTISALGQASAKMSKDETLIRAALERTSKGWNSGDLNEYLSAYTKEATEMLSSGPAGGVEAIEKTMKEGFWKTGKPLQSLSYESLNVRFLGKKNARSSPENMC
jgi:hypothetical protein